MSFKGQTKAGMPIRFHWYFIRANLRRGDGVQVCVLFVQREIEDESAVQFIKLGVLRQPGPSE